MSTFPKAGLQPSNLIARREQERQEAGRLRRPSEVKSGGGRGPGLPRPPSAGIKPGSAHRSRPAESKPRSSGQSNSRPPSAPPSLQRRSSSQGPRPSQIEEASRQLLSKGGLGAYQVACSAAAAAAAAHGGRRAKSVAPRLETSFMTSQQKRFDDAQDHLAVSSEVERKILMEELQSWYFSQTPSGTAATDQNNKGCCGGDTQSVRRSKSPANARSLQCSRPLEGVPPRQEAAASVKPNVMASSSASGSGYMQASVVA
eukprot:TRINITY_DN35831_c0_g1_i1.p1 TRINITY_DN35831_c0_g1~~TRINITY_DN35831_c0_g1_i1.p1  ORF type:complete len:258 (+),score=53.66 TRINITY_DN35831_c0_g1_i1:102-875(+)